jgi:uncharacterized OsmC-like protein
MSKSKTVKIEALIGDKFSVKCQVGDKPCNEGDGSIHDPQAYFLLSFGSCIAAIAGIVAKESEIPKAVMKMELSGEMSGFEPHGAEVALSLESEGMSREDKKSFLDEMDANLRSITHLTKNKLL